MSRRLRDLMAIALLGLCSLSQTHAASPNAKPVPPADSIPLADIDGRFRAEQAWMAHTLERMQELEIVLSKREVLDLFVKTMLGQFPDPDDQESADVLVMDEDPAAYYERAPSAMARRMRLSLESSCKSEAASSIFCGDIHIWFLREVSELGNKSGEGYACTGVYARNKYFSPLSIYRSSGCVPMYCPEGKKLCSVSTERLLAATHEYSPSKPNVPYWIH